MDSKKQKILIEYLISSSDTFALCQNIIRPVFFDPEHRNAVDFIKTYYEKYNNTPTTDQIQAETGKEYDLKQITPDAVKYCTDEIEQFCRRRAIEKAVLASPELIEKGDYGTLETTIRDAVLLSLNKSLGTSYFENPEERLRRMLEQDPVEPTGWAEIDSCLFGGVARKELLLFSANSGGGKSITLANLGLNFAKRSRNVLYVTLELAEEIVAQRYDTMITGIGRKEWRTHVSEIATRIHQEQESGVGRIDIKYMRTGTCGNDIRAYLKEYFLHNKIYPDLLIVDYMDKMSPNEHVNVDQVFTKDQKCAEELRQIAVDFNMVVATASQLNREAVKAVQHDHSHIAGGISKINESDVYISIKMNESMRVKGEILFTLQKTRNSDGVGKNVFLKYNGKTLRITDGEGISPSFIPTSIKKNNNPMQKNTSIRSSSLLEDKPTGEGLLDLLSD